MEKTDFRSTSRWFGLAFIILAVIMMISSIRENKEWNDVRKNGVHVEARIVELVENIGVDDDWEVTFAYSYDGRDYQYVQRNYPSGRYLGKVVSAYIYPDKPDVLYASGSLKGTYVWAILGAFGLVVFLYGIWDYFPEKKTKVEKQAAKETWDSL